MRPFKLSLFLLLSLAAASSPVGATWKPFGDQAVAALDFYNAHLGLVSFDDPTHTIQMIQDSAFLGVYSASDVVRSLLIQDTANAWAVIDNHGLYKGNNYWRTWTNTSTRNDLTLVGSTPLNVFLTAGTPIQLLYSSDGTSFTAAIGILDQIVAMDYLSTSTIIAVAATSIYRSSDGGTSWTRVKTGLTGAASVFADRARGIVYTGGDQLRMSKDSGRTWVIVYAPPELQTFHELDGQVFGAHDCTGTFYISNGPSHGNSVVRSQSQAVEFEDCDLFPQGLSNIRKGWTFDRGSILYWWDKTNGCSISRDGLTGLITNSVALAIEATADPLRDTICGAPSQALRTHVTSTLCAGVMIDSISIIRAKGSILHKFTPHTLFGDSTTITLSYSGRTAGTDSISLRLWFHSLEWGVREYKDMSTTATVTALPAVLEAPSQLDFGSVRVDSSRYLTLQISNTGCEALRVDSVVASDPSLFAIAFAQFPASLKSDSTWKLRVTFTPRAVGDVIESIELGTSAGHKFIELDGSGTRNVSNVAVAIPERSFSIYPNPATNSISVRGCPTGTTLDLFDLLGRHVLHSTLSGSDGSCEIGELPAGIYSARCSNGFVTRLEIQH